MIQVSLGIKRDLISKIASGIKAGGVAQALEHLSTKQEILSSNPYTAISKITRTKNFQRVLSGQSKRY
jgi:hypothetical protein